MHFNSKYICKIKKKKTENDTFERKREAFILNNSNTSNCGILQVFTCSNSDLSQCYNRIWIWSY
jgi:hypothetical protein